MNEGRPGGYLHRQIQVRATVMIVVLMVVGVLLWLGFVRWQASVAAIVLLLLLYRMVEGGPLDPTPWIRGLRGERAVAEVLAGLPHGVRAIHDLPTSHGNVDHVVVGPTGVFAIETKHDRGRFSPHRGRLTHRGQDASHILTQAAGGAIDVRRRLERAGMFLWVEALVVSTRGIVHQGRLRFGKVTVLDVAELTRYITERPRRITPEQVDRAAMAITTAHLTSVR